MLGPYFGKAVDKEQVSGQIHNEWLWEVSVGHTQQSHYVLPTINSVMFILHLKSQLYFSLTLAGLCDCHTHSIEYNEHKQLHRRPCSQI